MLQQYNANRTLAMKRSKKYASYTDDEIIKLSSANLPLRSKSYLDIELELRSLKQAAKDKKLGDIKSKRSYKIYFFVLIMAVFFAIRMFQRYA
ncbi:MAG: hypothetical protein ACI90U_001182 [Pseudomonadales bacterium]